MDEKRFLNEMQQHAVNFPPSKIFQNLNCPDCGGIKTIQLGAGFIIGGIGLDMKPCSKCGKHYSFEEYKKLKNEE